VKTIKYRLYKKYDCEINIILIAKAIELRVSLTSEHDDVIPSEISTACQGTTVETTQMLPPVYQSMSVYPY